MSNHFVLWEAFTCMGGPGEIATSLTSIRQTAFWGVCQPKLPVYFGMREGSREPRGNPAQGQHIPTPCRCLYVSIWTHKLRGCPARYWAFLLVCFSPSSPVKSRNPLKLSLFLNDCTSPSSSFPLLAAPSATLNCHILLDWPPDPALHWAVQPLCLPITPCSTAPKLRASWRKPQFTDFLFSFILMSLSWNFKF